MNPDESQTPEPIDEWLEQIQPENPEPENLENPENLSEASVLEIAEPTPSVEPQPVFSGELADSTDKGTVESTNNFVQQLETETTTLDSEIESAASDHSLYTQAEQRINELQRTEALLKEEIANLQAAYKILQGQFSETQTALGKIVQESLAELEQRKQKLQISVEQLERRQERIRNEMRTTFAGTSQDLAIRVQGFKDYLAGSLQDLAAAAEQLQLVPAVIEREKAPAKESKPNEPQVGTPQFAQQQFQDTTKQVRRLIEQYRHKPDYYGPAWQLRRTFEPVHAERVANWFLTKVDEVLYEQWVADCKIF